MEQFSRYYRFTVTYLHIEYLPDTPCWLTLGDVSQITGSGHKGFQTGRTTDISPAPRLVGSGKRPPAGVQAALPVRHGAG